MGTSFRLPDGRSQLRRAASHPLEKHGATISENERSQLVATIDREPIPFTCREKLRQVTRPLTPEEKRWESWNRSGVKKELEPTGRLELQIHAWTGEPLKKVWLETERRPIGAMLPEIVATLLVLGPVLAERSRRQAAEARLFAERQRVAELERQERQMDDNRFRRLCEIAEGWQRVELARAFIARLREVEPDDLDALIDGRSGADWLDWAAARATELDPVAQGVERVFTDIAQVSAWSYRD